MIPSQPEFPEVIGGKMVGTELALMIAEIKRISQVFWRFKTCDMLALYEVSVTLGFRGMSDLMRSAPGTGGLGTNAAKTK
jgi:hypothetical protein